MKRAAAILILVAAIAGFVSPVCAGQSNNQVGVPEIAYLKDMTKEWLPVVYPAANGKQASYADLMKYRDAKGTQLERFAASITGKSKVKLTLVAAYEDAKSGKITIIMQDSNGKQRTIEATPVLGSRNYDFKQMSSGAPIKYAPRIRTTNDGNVRMPIIK